MNIRLPVAVLLVSLVVAVGAQAFEPLSSQSAFTKGVPDTCDLRPVQYAASTAFGFSVPVPDRAIHFTTYQGDPFGVLFTFDELKLCYGEQLYPKTCFPSWQGKNETCVIRKENGVSTIIGQVTPIGGGLADQQWLSIKLYPCSMIWGCKMEDPTHAGVAVATSFSTGMMWSWLYQEYDAETYACEGPGYMCPQ